MVERQPYSNVPVYVVCPRNGEGHSWTLHWADEDASMAGVEYTSTSAPVPSVDVMPHFLPMFFILSLKPSLYGTVM